MSIPFEIFLEWANARFDPVKIKNDEIKINSVFCDDSKQHLWCNPSGGKKNVEHGVFRCWKTDKRGSLISLVMQVDGCNYWEALQTLGCRDATIDDLQIRFQELLNQDQQVEKEVKVQKEFKECKLPPGTCLVSDIPTISPIRRKCDIYLKSRGFTASFFFVCTSGFYRDRIIIPYYDKNKKLIFFNGRYFGSYEKAPKYLAAGEESGVTKEDVLFFPDWPEKGSKVYVTEGEFDALSLFRCGVWACASGGKYLSEGQLKILKDYDPVLAFDFDGPGVDALIENGKKMQSLGFNKIEYINPPKGYKDWNSIINKVNPKLIREYVLKTKNFDPLDIQLNLL